MENSVLVGVTVGVVVEVTISDGVVDVNSGVGSEAPRDSGSSMLGSTVILLAPGGGP